MRTYVLPTMFGHAMRIAVSGVLTLVIIGLLALSGQTEARILQYEWLGLAGLIVWIFGAFVNLENRASGKSWEERLGRFGSNCLSIFGAFCVIAPHSWWSVALLLAGIAASTSWFSNPSNVRRYAPGQSYAFVPIALAVYAGAWALYWCSQLGIAGTILGLVIAFMAVAGGWYAARRVIQRFSPVPTTVGRDAVRQPILTVTDLATEEHELVEFMRPEALQDLPWSIRSRYLHGPDRALTGTLVNERV